MTGTGWLVPAATLAFAAFASYLLGRRIGNSPDDGLLNERVHAHRIRVRLIGCCAAIVPAVFFALSGWPGLGPELSIVVVVSVVAHILAASVGELPLIRRLQQDPAPLLVATGELLRLLLAFGAHWIALFLAPFAVAASADIASVVAALLGVCLISWSVCAVPWTWWILRVLDLDAGALRDRCDRIDSLATAPKPRVGVFGRASGGMANAFAMAFARQPRIAFTRRLIAVCSVDEAAAIYAHETAHLEADGRERAKRIMWTYGILTVTGCSAVPVIGVFDVDLVELFLWLWLPVMLLALWWLASDSQDHESASDLRAAQLCGDRDALIRALTRLHSANFLPRRMATDAESQASHPSLARRIRDLRAGVNESGDTARREEVFVDPSDAVARVSIDAMGVSWTSADGEALRQELSDLSELRVVPTARGPVLRAVTASGGGKQEQRLADGDVERAQAMLDAVDGALGNRVKKVNVTLLVTLPVFAALAGFPAFPDIIAPEAYLFLVVPALVTAVTRRLDWALAVGAMTAAAGIHALARGGDDAAWSAAQRGGLLVMAMLGAYAVLLLLPVSRDRFGRSAVQVLGGFALLSVGVTVAGLAEPRSLWGLVGIGAGSDAGWLVCIGAGFAALRMPRLAAR